LKKINIFLSYSSQEDEIAKKLIDSLKKSKINVIVDRYDLDYGESIKEFLEQVRNNDLTFVIIDNNFLKSENNMLELTQALKEPQNSEKIIPIISQDNLLLSEKKGIEIIDFWSQKEDELKKIVLYSNYKDSFKDYWAKLGIYSEIKNNIDLISRKVNDENILVFDMGAGTTDLSILNLHSKILSIINHKIKLEFIDSKFDSIEVFLNTFSVLNMGEKLFLNILENPNKKFRSYNTFRNSSFRRKSEKTLFEINSLRKSSPLFLEILLGSTAAIWTIIQIIDKVKYWKLNKEEMTEKIKKLKLENQKLERELKEFDDKYEKVSSLQTFDLDKGIEDDLNEYEGLILKEFEITTAGNRVE